MLCKKQIPVASVEIADSGPKVLPISQLHQRAGVVLTALVGNLIAPPVELLLGELKAEEDDDSCDGDAAGPGCG
jgi:hypothetical protein